MNCLQNFVIGPHDEKTDFVLMSEKATNLDKADFLDTGYPVSEQLYPRKIDKEGSSSGKGKRPRWDTGYLKAHGTDKGKPIDFDDEEEEDAADVPLSQIPITPRAAIASTLQPTDSDLRGSSDTSAPGMETPNSSQRIRGKRKIDVTDDPSQALVKLVTTMNARMENWEERQVARDREAWQRELDAREREREANRAREGTEG